MIGLRILSELVLPGLSDHSKHPKKHRPNAILLREIQEYLPIQIFALSLIDCASNCDLAQDNKNWRSRVIIDDLCIRLRHERDAP